VSFAIGDKVLYNGGVLAEIVNYDVGANIVVLRTRPGGGGEEIVTAHISNTRLEALNGQTFEQAEESKPGKSERDAVTNDSTVAGEPVEAVEPSSVDESA
jgi:hypothetical protein